MAIKNIDYNKFREYLNYNVDMYHHFINTEVQSKDKILYLLTIKDSANDCEILKKFIPKLTKKLRKENLSYFSSWEIGKKFLLHNHIDVVCDNKFELEQMIQKYMNHKTVNDKFSSISVHLKEIKNIDNYNYITKKFDVCSKQSFDGLDNDGFYGYVKLLNRYFNIYQLFSFKL